MWRRSLENHFRLLLPRHSSHSPHPTAPSPPPAAVSSAGHAGQRREITSVEKLKPFWLLHSRQEWKTLPAPWKKQNRKLWDGSDVKRFNISSASLSNKLQIKIQSWLLHTEYHWGKSSKKKQGSQGNGGPDACRLNNYCQYQIQMTVPDRHRCKRFVIGWKIESTKAVTAVKILRYQCGPALGGGRLEKTWRFVTSLVSTCTSRSAKNFDTHTVQLWHHLAWRFSVFKLNGACVRQHWLSWLLYGLVSRSLTHLYLLACEWKNLG